MGVDARKLQQFVAVAEELNFRRAAERLHMSQPPLSHAIKELELALGVTLFQRGKRFVKLTAAGGAFLVEARLAIAQFERAVKTAREAGNGYVGRLRVAFAGSMGYEFIPSVLRAFRSEYPEVELDLAEATTLQAIAAVRSRRVDVGFVRPPLFDGGDLKWRAVYSDRLIVALPEGHRLARYKRIKLGQLAGEDFVGSHGVLVPGLRAQVVRLCQSAGFTPNVRCEMATVPAIVSLVSGRMGVALVPGAARAAPHLGVIYRDLLDGGADAQTEVRAIWHQSEDSPILRNFLEVAARESAAIDGARHANLSRVVRQSTRSRA